MDLLWWTVGQNEFQQEPELNSKIGKQAQAIREM